MSTAMLAHGIVEGPDVVFTYKCAVPRALGVYIADRAICVTLSGAMHRHIKNIHHKKCARDER